uniref:Uncharacterized protein n=1 Tax=Moniliophthora roreri TaxID=221103 RepID=A0A0W0FXE4_MONRR
MENANPTRTPLPAGYKPTANKGEANSTIRSQFQSSSNFRNMGQILLRNISTKRNTLFDI